MRFNETEKTLTLRSYVDLAQEHGNEADSFHRIKQLDGFR